MTCLVWHHLLLTLNSVISAIVQSVLTNAFPDSTKDAKEKKFQVFFFSFFALRCGLFIDSFWRLAWTALGAMFYFPKYSAFFLVPGFSGTKMRQVHLSDVNSTRITRLRQIIRLQNPSK